MAGVKTNTLPQSFQDAVWLAHELGIRYLWIDSLCILQDDPEDWARESAHMSDVYGYAALTISASRAASCTEGFLHNRTRPNYVSIPMQTNSHSGDILAFVLPRKYAADEIRGTRLEREPLSDRGWAFQERYLSPRSLHFGHWQTFFECSISSEAEDFCSVDTEQVDVCQIPPSGRDYSWTRVVAEYSRRKLTFPEDKLPALAGLARHLVNTTNARQSDGEAKPQIPNGGYLAGLRWDNLIDDLCWSLDRHAPKGERPHRYRAPSWSWASIDGCIEYNSACRPHLAVARDAHVDLDTAENPLGKVNGGWLYMEALRLTPVLPEGEPDHQLPLWFHEDHVSFYVYPTWDAESHLPLRRDMGGTIVGEKPELLAIPLAWDRDLAKRASDGYIFGPFCLIVTAMDHGIPEYKDVHGFRRVGSGLAQTDQPEPLTRLAEKWTAAQGKGELEHMLLF